MTLNDHTAFSMNINNKRRIITIYIMEYFYIWNKIYGSFAFLFDTIYNGIYSAFCVNSVIVPAWLSGIMIDEHRKIPSISSSKAGLDWLFYVFPFQDSITFNYKKLCYFNESDIYFIIKSIVKNSIFTKHL